MELWQSCHVAFLQFTVRLVINRHQVLRSCFDSEDLGDGREDFHLLGDMFKDFRFWLIRFDGALASDS